MPKKASTKTEKSTKSKKSATKATPAVRDVSTVKSYEIMLILQPDLRESEVKKKLKEFDEFLAIGKAEIVHVDLMGKDELAYKIKGHKTGIYVVYNLLVNTAFIHEINQHLRIDKDVIRYILINLPTDYTYTKYDTEPEAKEEKPDKTARTPQAHVTEKTTKAPAPKETDDSGKAPDQSKLDEKLDKILGGDL